MHAETYRYVSEFVERHGPFRRVVELGSRDVNGSVRPLFLGAAYTGVDLLAGRGVDVVADGAVWRPDASVECVVCCETLEHASDPRAVVHNALAMLAPGGYLVLTAATPERPPHSGIDGGALHPGEHYRGIELADLRVFYDWPVLFSEVDHVHGDVRAVIEKWPAVLA